MPRARRARRKDARPGELLAAALELFVEKGYAATRVEEVAQRAGVSKGTLFLYFPTKEDLFKAVVREHIVGHFPGWNAEFEAFAGGTAELLRHFLLQWWLRVGATQVGGLMKLMMSEAGNFPELAAFYRHEVIEPGHGLVRNILRRGIQRGEFRAIDLEVGVFTVLAPMMFLMTWRHSFDACAEVRARIEPERYLETQIETLLHGLCRPAPTTRAKTTRPAAAATKRAPAKKDKTR